MQDEALIQLFILPYAGGTVGSFRRLSECIDARIDVITVEYSGRGTRSAEPLAGSFEEMIDDSAEYCVARRKTNIPFAVMGYSMGGIMGYELLAENKIPGKLEHFFICAEVSPKVRASELGGISSITDDYVLERARNLGGMYEKMLTDKRFAQIYVRPMLSDYKNFLSYSFDSGSSIVCVDHTFMYCEKDTPIEAITKWNELIKGSSSYYEMGDNHFFINQYYEKMSQIINDTLL